VKAERGVSPVRLVHVTTVPMSLTFLRGQVGFMKARGYRVYALSSPGPDLDAFSEAEGVEVRAVEMPRRITPLRDLRAVLALLREFRRIEPVIVHAHTPKGGLLGMITARLGGAPVRIYHMRGLPHLTARGWKRRLLIATEWISCRLAHQVLCVSHSIRREAVAAGVCPSEKIKVLLGGSGNGVDAGGRFDPGRQGAAARGETRSRFGIPHDAVVVGFVGRIVRDKGVIELARAWQVLREERSDLHLLLVGPFEPQDPLPEEVHSVLRDDDRVHHAGMDWNTPPLYAAMDVVALPTYREGFPNVPLEAAAMSLPVVATRVPGCVDAVEDGVTGILVEAGDPDDLTAALRRYVLDPALRHRHGAAGRARVLRDFRREAIWEALEAQYRSLLAEKQGVLRAAAGIRGSLRAGRWSSGARGSVGKGPDAEPSADSVRRIV
jgi:glycosyltransferase involved in cell wall biosynthesis